MIKEFKTRTGAIYCDTDKTLEYLYVGESYYDDKAKVIILKIKK